MAEVFRAVVVGPQEFQRVIVVKRILPRLCADPAFVKMFIDEATLCGRLSHPNIIQVHEFGLQAGQYFIAMEYLQGRSLGQILRRLGQRRQGLPFTIAAEILRQVCRGLAYAHTLTAADGRPLGIVHRDVSPGNVFVAHNGAVKLLDFGIARVEDHFRLGDTQPGQLKGKSAYLSPEQITSKVVDHRADIFTAGILLYEMITGRRLFKAANPLECMNLITSLRVPLPSQLEPNVPARLESIVLRALRKAPEERFQTAADMADKLEAFLIERQCSSRDLPTFMGRLFEEDAGDNQTQLTRDELREVLVATGQSPRITTEYPVARPSPASGMRAIPGEPVAAAATSSISRTEVLARLPHWHRGVWLSTAAIAVLSILVVLRHTMFRSLHETESRESRALAMSGTIAAARAPAGPRQARPASAAPVRPAAPITLSIESDPSGALVFEHGVAEPLGVTPLRVTRPPGRERLIYRLTRTGHIEGVLQVVPDADKVVSAILASTGRSSARASEPQRNAGKKVRNALPINPFQP